MVVDKDPSFQHLDQGVEGEVAAAPPGAFYLVLTHRHDLDLRIADAILRRADFGFFGLIGSKTKRRQFIRRFEERGIAASSIACMTCPIGLPGIDGKEPETIAAAVVALMYSGGTFLESFAAGRARREMTDLLSRVPRTATLHQGDTLTEVALDRILPGDLLLIRQGAVAPVVGTVAGPGALLDQ